MSTTAWFFFGVLVGEIISLTCMYLARWMERKKLLERARRYEETQREFEFLRTHQPWFGGVSSIPPDTAVRLQEGFLE